MNLFVKFDLFFKALVSPYRYHESSFFMSISESVMMSWVFAVINGIFKIVLLNIVLLSLSNYVLGFDLGAEVFKKDGNLGYYFLILSTILEIIFFPLFTLFLLQFWTFIIKAFAKFLKVAGDIDLLVERVVTASMSAHVFIAIPIFGSFLQKVYSLVLLFIGMKKQLNFSSAVSICVLFSPVIFSMIVVMFGMTFIILKNL